MNNTISHIIYDVINRIEITFYKGQFLSKCKELKLDNTKISHLVNEDSLSMDDRYILPKNKNKIFTLIDFNTQKEYDCITNKTIFIHLGINYNNNEGKYIYEIKNQRQSFATIGNILFYLKGTNPKYPKAKTNSEETKEIIKIRNHHKLKSKLVNSLRNRLLVELNKRNKEKDNRVIELVGCSLDELIIHLESQFKNGMTWENHGKIWHIDHIKPCYTFNLFNLEEQKECFNYKNLRPLWITTKVAREFLDFESIGNLNRLKKAI